MAVRSVRAAARAAARAAIVLTAILSLGSCEFLGFIFSSVFPATAALVKGQADLSGQIPAGAGQYFSLRVVEAGGYGYVVLIGTPPATDIATAYIYDLDLNLKSTQTNLFPGSGVMADASGYIVLGSRQLNPADLSLVTTLSQTVTTPGSQGEDGFVASSNNILNFSMNGTILSYAGYNAGWTLALAVPTQNPISSAYPSPGISAVFDDGNPTGNAVFVMRSSTTPTDNPQLWFVTLPKSVFGSTYPAGIMDSSPSRNNLETETLGYAQGSIFAYDTSSSSFVKIDPSTGATQARLISSVDPKNTRFAYAGTGGSFYAFDTDTRVLTKYASWW